MAVLLVELKAAVKVDYLVRMKDGYLVVMKEDK